LPHGESFPLLQVVEQLIEASERAGQIGGRKSGMSVDSAGDLIQINANTIEREDELGVGSFGLDDGHLATESQTASVVGRGNSGGGGVRFERSALTLRLAKVESLAAGLDVLLPRSCHGANLHAKRGPAGPLFRGGTWSGRPWCSPA